MKDIENKVGISVNHQSSVPMIETVRIIEVIEIKYDTLAHHHLKIQKYKSYDT